MAGNHKISPFPGKNIVVPASRHPIPIFTCPASKLTTRPSYPTLVVLVTFINGLQRRVNLTEEPAFLKFLQKKVHLLPEKVSA